MFSSSNNHNSATPLAVLTGAGNSSGNGIGVPRVIHVNSPSNENTNSTKGQQSIPSVAEPTPKVRNGGATGGKTPTTTDAAATAPASSSDRGDNRSLASASSGTTASSSSSRAHNSLVAASDDVDSKSRASSTSFSVPRGCEGARVGTATDTKVKSIDTSSGIPIGKPSGVSARPPRPIPTDEQRNQRQQMVSQSIAFQHGEDATTLCSSVADDSRNDHSSLGGSASAFSGGSERDSMTNSVGFSYEEDEDGHDDRTDDGYEGLAGNAPIYDCGLFGIDGQPEDDFEKFYDDLSIDSQGRDGLDRERSARHKEKMKQMALALRKRTRGRKGHKNKHSAASLGTDGGSVITAVAQDICSPKVAKARIEMAYENYLHTYKFDTVKTPTASNKTNNNDEMESRQIDRRRKRGKLSNKRLVSDADGDVAVATSTVPPFQGSVEMDCSAGSSNGSVIEHHTCPMCSSKLLHQHRRVLLDALPAVPHAHDAHIATATNMTARATNPRGHDNKSSQKFMGATSDDCFQCADKCPGSVQPTVKSFLQHIFASSSTEHRDDDVTNAKGSMAHQQTVEKDPYRDENHKNTPLISNADYEERPVPPYCAECRTYIVTEATEAELREEMLANLSEWMVDTNDEEDEEDIEFKVASLKPYEDGTVVVDRPLRGNILVFLDDDGDDKVLFSNQDMDEQSVTTRQQENLSPAPVPTLPTYPGLHLVSSGEVQARGREVLPPPPVLLPSISEDPEVPPHTKQADDSPIFAAQFGPPDASVPFSDALNHTARPNKQAEVVQTLGNNAIAEASSIDQTPSIRTEDEQAEITAS